MGLNPVLVYRTELADGAAPGRQNLPVKITVCSSNVLVEIMDTTGQQSCAEVYVEHQDSRVTVHAWDQHTDPDFGDPQSIVLLADSSNRERQRYVTCENCGREFAEDDTECESTYCGSFCRVCLPDHLAQCSICGAEY